MTLAARARRAIRSWLRARGYDVVRYTGLAPVDSHLQQLLAQLDIDGVLDVGAHVGGYGLMLRQFGYTGRIVSFEPVAANVSELRRRLDPDWTLVYAAVGNENGHRPIRITAGSQQHSFLPTSEYGNRLLPGVLATVGEEMVEVVRLDDAAPRYLEGSERVLLKTDTQGFDLEVLRGAERTLDRVVAVQLELSLQHSYEDQADYLETLGWLRERGFVPSGIFPFLIDPSSLIVEAECICLRGGA